MRLGRAAAGALTALGLAAPAHAAPALELRPCRGEVAMRCGTLTVPLDRTGTLAGRLRLAVRASGPRSGPVIFALNGGPGQAGADLAEPGFGVGTFTRERVVALDQRGTGAGALRCRAWERAASFFATDAAARCARELGPKRVHFTSRDTADDLDDLRRALGFERVDLYGVSYGTQTALTYLRLHPERVRRVVLDSTVGAEATDPAYGPSLRAIPRVLRELCAGARGRCRAITTDPVADLAAIVRRLPLAGRAVGRYDRRGRRRAITLDRRALFGAVLLSDLDAGVRQALPSALAAGRAGDFAPLGRLAQAVRDDDRSTFTSPRDLSPALYAATICEEQRFPWARTLPLAARPVAVARYVAGVDPKAIYPFDRATLSLSDEFATCLRWPSSARSPDLGGTAIPDRPILILSGRADVRTPLEQSRAVAARAPRATVIPAARVGHGVIGGSCANSRTRAFLRGRRVARPCGASGRYRLPPPWPATLGALAPVPGTTGRAGRTLAVVALALGDAARWGDHEEGRAGGLHGGWFSTGRTLVLHADRVVPGVAITGRLRAVEDGLSGTLRISGAAAARGALRISGRMVTGRLGGRAVRSRLPGSRTPR